MFCKLFPFPNDRTLNSREGFKWTWKRNSTISIYLDVENVNSMKHKNKTERDILQFLVSHKKKTWKLEICFATTLPQIKPTRQKKNPKEKQEKLPNENCLSLVKKSRNVYTLQLPLCFLLDLFPFPFIFHPLLFFRTLHTIPIQFSKKTWILLDTYIFQFSNSVEELNSLSMHRVLVSNVFTFFFFRPFFFINSYIDSEWNSLRNRKEKWRICYLRKIFMISLRCCFCRISTEFVALLLTGFRVVYVLFVLSLRIP